MNAETNTCEGDLGAAIEVNGEVDFTTGDNGIATIAGLYVGKNGDSQTRDYCVVETVPPAGYVIDETPRLIRVAPGITADLELEFENQLRPGPDLPMTGGMGTPSSAAPASRWSSSPSPPASRSVASRPRSDPDVSEVPPMRGPLSSAVAEPRGQGGLSSPAPVCRDNPEGR